jgi:hypothetical protein
MTWGFVDCGWCSLVSGNVGAYVGLGLVAFDCLLAGFVKWKLRPPVEKSAGRDEYSVDAIRERVERERERVERERAEEVVWPTAADLRKATSPPSRLRVAPYVLPAKRVRVSLATRPSPPKAGNVAEPLSPGRPLVTPLPGRRPAPSRGTTPEDPDLLRRTALCPFMPRQGDAA